MVLNIINTRENGAALLPNLENTTDFDKLNEKIFVHFMQGAKKHYTIHFLGKNPKLLKYFF
jgi:hypothetical protein